jgi:D-alanyl-D-alanine carboxypeptidase
MLRKILLWVVLPLVVLAIGSFIWAYFYVKPDANRIVDFLIKHKNKSAIYLIINNEAIAAQNADTVMPTASAVKTLIAAEFAHQAFLKRIDENALIDTAELNKYYLRDTDGGAHDAWLSSINNQLTANKGKISLMEIAKGMIAYSSNANSAFLLDVLGINHIQQTADSLLDFTTHSPLYDFVGALTLYQKKPNEEYKDFIARIDQLSAEEYRNQCADAHLQLKNNPRLKQELNYHDIDLKAQRIWSNRLPGGSPKEYAQMMLRIQKGFNQPKMDSLLRVIMEQHELSTESPQLLKRYGSKGGSTAFILTQAAYFTDNQNNSGALAVFFNNLSPLENIKLQASLNEFEKKCFTDETFRKNLQQQLNIK